MVRNVIQADKLLKVMMRYSLDEFKVAELTNSCSRSVYRWEIGGIPVNKWELLKLKLGIKEVSV